MLTTEQAAYFAGVIDGEGHLAIVRAVKASGGSPRFNFVMKVTNTKREWLEELQTWVGGHIYQIGASPKRLNSRPCFDLRLLGAQAQTALLEIRPFLMLKSRHAEILLRYFNVAHQRRAANAPGRVTDPKWITELDALHRELRSINMRGLYQTWQQGAPKKGRLCSLPNCGRPHHSNDYCKQHHKKFIERGGPARHEKVCSHCSQAFVSKRSDARFCSPKCANIARYREKRQTRIVQ